MGKTGQFAEKQTAAVQSAGFEKFKTVMSKVNSVINLVGVWLFRLRKFIMAAPVVYAAIRLASYNGQHLPEQVGLDLQSTGEFAMTVSRQLAVMGPLGLTAACLTSPASLASARSSSVAAARCASTARASARPTAKR